MLPKRLITYLNVLIGVLLLIAAVAIFWWAYLPLPKTGGTVTAPIAATAKVERDRLGVPHITAGSIEDALFLQGYATAQDRLWQMEGLRRYAAGELSEVIGKATVETDRTMRQLRMARIAEEEARRLPAKDRAYFDAYARGVNYFIATHRAHLPVEFTMLQCDPRPWTVADSIMTGLVLFQSLTNTMLDELRKGEMLSVGDAAKVNYLFPERGGPDFQPGSNAWVLSGARTTTGKPILANDPHLEHSLPSRWYMAHLHAGPFEVTGVTLPGLPGVIIGHNGRFAWGITNLHFDVQDLYIEQLDAQSGRYVFQGRQEQARLEREVIRVKGERPIELSRWVTRHGPIVETQGGRSLALRWTASDPGGFRYPFLNLNAAGNWNEFREILSTFPGPGSNFVYADVDGNIGYQVAGKLPVRRQYRGDVPANGVSGENEWDGYIPFDQLPTSFNPPSGMIVTANQNPFPANYPFDVHGSFGPGYRAGQIRSVLTTKPKWGVQDMVAIQKDVYSPYLHFLAQQMVKAAEGRSVRDERAQAALQELKQWNGQMEAGKAAPMIASLLSQYVIKALAERAAPGKSALYTAQISTAVVEKTLREKPAGWFDDYQQMLLEAFVDALDEGSRAQGRRPAKWDWGRYNELSFINPIVSRLPYVGRYFDVGPVPMSGSSTTVKQTTRRLMPSMRFVADLADWDQSLNNITFGQSGQPLSSHYKDQWEAFYTGRSFPMQFRKVAASDTLTVNPQ